MYFNWEQSEYTAFNSNQNIRVVYHSNDEVLSEYFSGILEIIIYDNTTPPQIECSGDSGFPIDIWEKIASDARELIE
jgi:hypothetical protein